MPRRGEVWLVDLGMVEKVRPALILSGPCGATERDVITIIPHTTTLRGSRFEIHICDIWSFCSVATARSWRNP